MSTLPEYLMEHGILKNADAEAMATEIEAQFARERDELRAELHRLKEHSLLCPRCSGQFHEADIKASPEKFWRCPYCHMHQHVACRYPLDPDCEAFEIITERDLWADAIQRTHIRLGGDGEWVGTKDLGESCVGLAGELRAKCAEMLKCIQAHHAHHLDGVRVFFSQDGKPIDIETDLTEAYVESRLCDQTLHALSTDYGKDLLEKLERLEHERDQAIHEAKRRDQKWMDGINEVVGEKLDFDDPCAANAASTALGKWAAKQKADQSGPCHECREPAMPMISVIGPHFPRGTGKPRQFCSIHCFWKWIRRVEESRDEAGRLDRIHSWD